MCIFCKIIDGEIPSKTIYEDDIVKCFLDLDQSDLGHTLIIPKEHTLDITTIDNDTLNHIYDVVKILKIRLENKLNIDGLTILNNSGIAQEVKHFHMHLIPKYENKKTMDIDELYEILKED